MHSHQDSIRVRILVSMHVVGSTHLEWLRKVVTMEVDALLLIINSMKLKCQNLIKFI